MELLERSLSRSVQATGRYRNMKTCYPDRTVLADPSARVARPTRLME